MAVRRCDVRRLKKFFLEIHTYNYNIYNPGRPIVSGYGSLTERIFYLVDNFLNPLVSGIPSFKKGTTDFLHKLEDVKHQIPDSAFLVTVDFVSLYTVY